MAYERAPYEYTDDGEIVPRPPIVWQKDPKIEHKQYCLCGDLTFGQAGCLVCCTYAIARFAGYKGELTKFAHKIDVAGAFRGGLLSNPAAVSAVVPEMKWHTRPKYAGRYGSFIDWHKKPAELEVLASVLEDRPVIIEVDFRPQTFQVEQHFVVAYRYVPFASERGIEDDLRVMDPWTGTYTSLLTYFNPQWLYDGSMGSNVTKVQRAIQGLRVWEVLE